MTARYWIAQQIQDLFRKEPRNIGVLVQVGDMVAARFFGEVENGQIDGRKLKGLPHSNVYKQWVKYWRTEITRVSPNLLVEKSGAHYRVIEGGEVSDIEGDPVKDVLNYLYALLVSEGGLTEALGIEETNEEQALGAFVDEVLETFQELKIIDTAAPLFIPHPIMRRVPIGGTQVNHIPEFVQRNGQLFVMEPVDFTVRYKQRSRDHAGWSAYMFSDIRKQQPKTETIAIVKITEEDKQHRDVSNGLAMLQNEAQQIVHWLETEEREKFLATRREVALTREPL
jgi:hypothetical protein